jgi:hypothetical protein
MTCAMHLPCRKPGRPCLGHQALADYCRDVGITVEDFQRAVGVSPGPWLAAVAPYWQAQPFYEERAPRTNYYLAQSQIREAR